MWLAIQNLLSLTELTLQEYRKLETKRKYGTLFTSKIKWSRPISVFSALFMSGFVNNAKWEESAVKYSRLNF